MQDDYEHVKPTKVVVTHNGQFHMDEVSAIAILVRMRWNLSTRAIAAQCYLHSNGYSKRWSSLVY